MLSDAPTNPLTPEQQQLFEQIFREDIPLLDLRSPSEFNKGAFPASRNIPLMTDGQRAKVGTEYKRNGQDAAIKLGHKLVSGNTRDSLVQQWSQYFTQFPNAYLYCFRGGLRSRTVQTWLQQVGIDKPLIKGGYKALRWYLIQQLHEIVTNHEWIVVGGRTGTAKTSFIQQFDGHLDLEGLAHHRGSSFGRRAIEQPSVINFENSIAIDLLKKKQHHRYLVEDEGVVIGRCSIPLPLRETMKQAPIVILTKPFTERVEIILHDYVIGLSEEYLIQFPEEGYLRYKQAMLEALGRIKKRLGGKRYIEIHRLLDNALNSKSLDHHREWITRLLTDYYDPMYDYQLENKQERVLVEGSESELREYLIANELKVT